MGFSLRIQGTGAVPGRAERVALEGEALSIGRAEGNDLVLPDPDRVISSRHCVIEARGDGYVLIDISTNGTFLNYAGDPLGPTPTPLSAGDVIAVGRYELRVEITAGAGAARTPFGDLPPPFEDAPLAAPLAAPRAGPVGATGSPRGEDILSALSGPGGGGEDFLDALISGGGGAGRPAVQPFPTAEVSPADSFDTLPDEDFLSPAPEAPVRGASVSDHSARAQDHFRPPAAARPMIPDDWDAQIGDEAAPPRPAAPGTPPAPPRPASPAGPPPRAAPAGPLAAPTMPGLDPPPRPRTAPLREALSAGGPDAATRAFLRAAGADGLDIPPEELEAVMARLGTAFRTLVTGLREVLMARAQVKNEFRLAQTMIAMDGNNPIKFSVSPDQAIEAMVHPSRPGYLDAPAAAREALEDVKAHEVAMMVGMQAALEALLARFDPERLKGRIDTGGVIADMLGGRKKRYWEAFESLYADIAREAEDDFQALFGREFARAYQAQVKKL